MPPVGWTSRISALSQVASFGTSRIDNVLSSDEADAVLKRLEFYAPPAVFVYDQQGKLSHKFGIDGEFTYAEVRKRVDELLAKP